jgi:hypothetical protein
MKINSLELGRYKVMHSEEGIQYFIDGTPVVPEDLPSDSLDLARLAILHHRFEAENRS